MSDVPFEEEKGKGSPSAEDEYLASLESTDPLDVLTERQRFVIELRFGLRGGRTHTQREVAALMGVSLKTIWEHERAAKKKLDYLRPRHEPPSNASGRPPAK